MPERAPVYFGNLEERAPTFRGVQALRAVAAAMVVVLHASARWSTVAVGSDARAWFQGQACVDIFFVISGFVMAVSSIGRGGGHEAAWSFLKKRLVRIMPLYWLVTTFVLLKVELGLVKDLRHLPLDFILRSYLLIPCVTPTGDTAPLAAVGWTLSFEMFFYLSFAFVLWMRRSVPLVLTLTLVPLALLGFFRTDHWPATTSLFSPLLLEFLFGIWLGRLTQLRRNIKPLLGAPLGIFALIAIWFLPVPTSLVLRRLDWGVCAFFVVQAAVVLEERLAKDIPPGCYCWAMLRTRCI